MPTFRRALPLVALTVLATTATAQATSPCGIPVRKSQPGATTGQTATCAAAADSGREIVVTAAHSASIPASRATLAVLVEGTGDAASDASRRAEVALINVSEVVRQLGSAATTLGVTPVGVSGTPNVSGFRHIPGRPAYRAGYVVRLQVPRPDDVTSVATAVLSAGARTTMPTFESATADSARRITYTEAMAQARQNAEAIAESMGGRLGPVVSVTTAEPPATMADGLPASDLTVGTAVTVRYRVLPR
jgi:uncharacterized protein YggE